MGKQTGKDVGALNLLNLSNKTDELKTNWVYFSKKLFELIANTLQDITKLQAIIKSNDLNHESKHGKTYSFGKYALPIFFIYIYIYIYIRKKTNTRRSW